MVYQVPNAPPTLDLTSLIDRANAALGTNTNQPIANEPFSVTGTITQFSSPSNFQVKGQAIDASQTGVLFINGTAANLATNVPVSVIGIDVVDGVLVATQVTF